MAETRSIPLGSPKRIAVVACAECGEPLASQAGGSDELCRYCYEAQFEPSRVRLGERQPGRRHHAH
jgi:hypothetical protein